MQFGPLEDLVTDERTILGFNENFKMLTYFSTDPRTFVLTIPVSSFSNLVFKFYGKNLLFCFHCFWVKTNFENAILKFLICVPGNSVKSIPDT